MTVLTEIKPFPVVHGKYLYIFTPAEEGGFSVSCENVDGVNAQGDTFEEALDCAISMTAFVEEVLADLEKEKKAKRVGRAKTGRTVTYYDAKGDKVARGDKTTVAARAVIRTRKKK